ncbi:hypothetical protein O0L34_g14865 [Tuta absoluta]|nr:hypothetical protein O0L34_g14865 [Tuta absoluta]
MEVDNRGRKNASTPCGCSCGWFKTRLTQDQDLIVHQQPLRHVRVIPKTSDGDEKKTVVSAVVLQNNDGNNIALQTEVFLPEFDVNEINCPRCRHHIKRAKALLKDVFVAKNNNICVCEMCDLHRLANVPCLHCENIRKKLKLNDFFVSRKKDLLIQQEHRFLKTILGRGKKDKQTRDFREFSDIHPTDTIERINKHRQRMQRPKSALDSKYEPFLEPESEWTGHDHGKKTSYLSRAKKFSLQNESLLGLGTKGFIRRFHSEESLRTFSTKEDKTFNYIFPRLKKDKNFMFETSAKELKDKRKRFPADPKEKFTEVDQIKKKKDEHKMIELAHQREISLSEIDFKTRKKQIEKTGTKLEKIKGQKDELKQDESGLLRKRRRGEEKKGKDKERRSKEYDKQVKEKGVQKKDQGEIFKKNHVDKKTETKLDRGDNKEEIFKEKGAEVKQDKRDVNKEKLLKEKEQYIAEIKEKKVKKELENRAKKVKKDTDTKRGMDQIKREKSADLIVIEKKPGGKSENKRKTVKEDTDTADSKRGTEKIQRDKTVGLSIKEKTQSVKAGENQEQDPLKNDATKTNEADEKVKDKEDKTQVPFDNLTEKKTEVTTDEKGTEMYHVDIDLNILPKNAANIKQVGSDKNEKIKASPGKKNSQGVEDGKFVTKEDNGKKRKDKVLSEKKNSPGASAKTKSQGVEDEVKLLNKVLTKQDHHKAVDKNEKKSRETILLSQKEKKLKTARTVTQAGQIVTEGDDVGDHLNKPVANKNTVDDVSDHQKKPVGDRNAVAVPLQNILISSDTGDGLLMKMINEANKSHKPPVNQKEVKFEVEPLPIPQRQKREFKAIDTEEPETDMDSLFREPLLISKPVREMVFGPRVILAKNAPPPEPELKSEPVLFQTQYNEADFNHTLSSPTPKKDIKSTKGNFTYALSDRKFIENGWTVLPTEKIVRKVNVYRMRPAFPEYDWFEHNKKRGTMRYSSGEKLAEIDEDGRGRWYYKNGRLALDYYGSEEPNSQRRYVVYSSGDQDERGRSTPITVLGMFDFNGNGVVFDHSGKIRLKYNQNEGIVLDRSVGLVTRWKWHSLNDPPELQQVMIDSQLEFKDPEIYSYDIDHQTRPQDKTLLELEYDNYIKSTEWKKEYKPVQIKMKTMKMNDQFTLKIQDQNRIYLLFRDGASTMKCNLGLEIDHNEIVDTAYCEVGEVCVPAEELHAATDSLADLQKCIKEAQKFNQVRIARELKKTPLPLILSADRMTAAASKPPRRPLLTEEYVNRTPAPENLYYNTGLI